MSQDRVAQIQKRLQYAITKATIEYRTLMACENLVAKDSEKLEGTFSLDITSHGSFPIADHPSPWEDEIRNKPDMIDIHIELNESVDAVALGEVLVEFLKATGLN